MKVEKINNWPLVGNNQITEFLEKSLASGNLAGTYIFCGPKDLGKNVTAEFFAQTILCSNKQTGAFSFPCGKCESCRLFLSKQSDDIAHGDFHILKKKEEKKNILVEEVRDFISAMSMSSFLGAHKIGLIKEADNLNQEGANALLKTLEEPRSKVVIILTVSRLDSLPKTIISRSQVLRFSPVNSSNIHDFLVNEKNFSRDAALNAAKISLGRPALAAKFAEDREFRLDYSAAVDCFLGFFRQGIAQRFKNIESLLSGRDKGKINKASEIISIWRGLGRDILLTSSGVGNLIQNHDKKESLEDTQSLKSTNYWIEFLRKIDLAESQLSSNVNPQLVLEGLAASI